MPVICSAAVPRGAKYDQRRILDSAFHQLGGFVQLRLYSYAALDFTRGAVIF